MSPVDPEVPVCEPLDGEVLPELELVSPVEPVLPVELPTPEEVPDPLVPVELPDPVLLVSPVDELPVPVDPEVSPAPASEVLLLGDVRPLRPCGLELVPVELDEPASEPVIP